VREGNPAVPAELERIIAKLLEKDRALRYQSAAEVRAELESIRSLTLAAQNVKRSRDRVSALSRQGAVSWLRYALAAAVLAAITLVVFLFHRSQAKPLTDQDILVLADFTNNTGEPVFDTALKQALAFQVQQPPFLKAMDDVEIQQALKQSGRSPDAYVTGEIARDICIREGAKATLEGSIAAIGSRYLIGLQTVNCQTGETFARGQAEAAGKDRVVEALDRVTNLMRAKLGESLSTIQGEDRAYKHPIYHKLSRGPSGF
jgi:hypothetical protein